MRLSVIVITASRNSLQLRRAVDSASFADEVRIVLTGGAVSDFAAVRNDALRQAKGEWVLFLDSDEQVTPELAQEIQKKTVLSVRQGQSLKDINGFYVRRQDRFLGQWLRHGETASLRLLRLARKETGWWERPVHEVWRVSGRVVNLKHPIIHYSHPTVDDMVEKLDRYSTIEAGYRRDRTPSPNPFALVVQLVCFPLAKFVTNYVGRLGFLDGTLGFIHAGLMSFHSFLVRAKLLTR